MGRRGAAGSVRRRASPGRLSRVTLAGLGVVLASLVVPSCLSLPTGPAPWGDAGARTFGQLAQPSPALYASFVTDGQVNGTCDPFTASLTFRATAADGVAPYNFSWDFGDGTTTAFGTPIVHAFHAVGGYNVTLRVVDATGARYGTNATVEVGPSPGCLTPVYNPLYFGGFLLLVGAGTAVAVGLVSLTLVDEYRSREAHPPRPKE